MRAAAMKDERSEGRKQKAEGNKSNLVFTAYCFTSSLTLPPSSPLSFAALFSGVLRFSLNE